MSGLPIINDQAETFSYTAAFISGGYTISHNSSAREKTVVVAIWIFSIISCGLFPATAFVACWIKDLVDTLCNYLNSNEPFDENYLDDLVAISQGSNKINNEQSDNNPLNNQKKTLTLTNSSSTTSISLCKIDNHLMLDLHKAMNILGNGNIFHLKMLQNSKKAKILENLETFDLFRAIFSNQNIVINLGKMAERKTISIPGIAKMNLLQIFIENIHNARTKMGEAEWQKKIKKFEAFCGINENDFAKLNTEDFVKNAIKRRDELHKNIQNKNAPLEKPCDSARPMT
jgi:hypothetical protein